MTRRQRTIQALVIFFVVGLAVAAIDAIMGISVPAGLIFAFFAGMFTAAVLDRAYK